MALWDTARDLTVKEGRPCLVSLFFRQFEGKLTLSATFRTHNAMDAWLLNVYGLMAIQAWVAEQAGLRPGAIVVVSHSLGLDPKELDRAMLIIGPRPFKVRLDPMGYFRITLDGKEILVEHRFEDVTLREYRGKTVSCCSTRSPGTWPSRISITPSTWAASWRRPRWPSRTAGSSCRISCQGSAISSSQGLGEGKKSGGRCPLS